MAKRQTASDYRDMRVSRTAIRYWRDVSASRIRVQERKEKLAIKHHEKYYTFGFVQRPFSSNDTLFPELSSENALAAGCKLLSRAR